MVLIGLPNVRALERAVAKLCAAGITYYRWNEPDNDLGFTALCTVPIAGPQRAALANYRVWSSQTTGQCVREHLAPLKREEAGSSPAWPANASVAQPTEHSASVERMLAGRQPDAPMAGSGRHSTPVESEPATNLEAC